MLNRLSLSAIAKLIDHSLLHPKLTDREIEAGFALAAEYRTAAVCVKPYSVKAARAFLQGTGVAVCAVAAFPHGNAATAVKAAEALAAVADGAAEIDAVVNIGKVLGEDWEYVAAEIRALNEAVVSRNALLKVIFETDFLENKHIERLCAISTEIGVAFVKTSTGYGFTPRPGGLYSYAGATEERVRLMRALCPPQIKVKAAGGIRTLDDLLRAVDWGADRIGASATRAILKEARERGYD